MKILKSILLLTTAILLTNCGGTADILSTPTENIDSIPLKVSSLTEDEQHTWGHLDLIKDTIPGMSVDKAYKELIKKNRGQTVIVAVIDSGIDIDHEDLNGAIWRNTNEISGNGIDDDNNGYVDDIHGWNFLGEGYDEQLEYVRLIASGNTSNPRFTEAQEKLTKEQQKATENKTRYEQIYQAIIAADGAVAKHLNKTDYTKEEVYAIKSQDQALMQQVGVLKQMFGFGLESVSEAKKEIKGGIDYFTERLNYHFNVDLKGRTTGDNPDDLNDKPGYGNGNVKHIKKDESHGTHVAGIIAAIRNNGKGVNGVANNVKIMSLRTVPNGDEYDKDVALAIRYAVDNGAKIINGSFGKDFSPHSDWVRDAIAYAGQKNVIFVHAAGNDSKNIDTNPNYPDDNVNNGPEVSNTCITVGATAPKYGSNLLASFSNYGKNNVDIFAPGGQIYSTVPENDYETNGGTSMAAPAVAGIAAVLMSQYPSLTAAQVKQIILDSGTPIVTKVIVGGDANNIKSLNEVSKSGRIANLYNALIMAKQMAKK